MSKTKLQPTSFILILYNYNNYIISTFISSFFCDEILLFFHQGGKILQRIKKEPLMVLQSLLETFNIAIIIHYSILFKGNWKVLIGLVALLYVKFFNVFFFFFFFICVVVMSHWKLFVELVALLYIKEFDVIFDV